MASKSFKKKKIEETAGSGFGQYQESVGGGASPNGSKKPGTHGHGVNSDYRQENNDTNQPRTNDGKFTYKSVNGQSIDPKYGPSRGKTVNPLLTGGENGVKIEDVETDFANKSGSYWNKYKDKWYHKGGEIVTSGDFKVRVAADAVWNVAKRRYDSVKGEFERESSVFAETKKGRSGAEEKAAIQKAKSSGEEQAVIEQSSGGIKLKPGTQITAPVKTAPVKSAGANGAGFVAPVGGNVGGSVNAKVTSVSDIANADYTPKYDDNDIAQARAILKGAGLSDSDLADFDAMSPKEKDDYIDKYFEADDTVEAENTEAESAEAENVEESESEKKIKAMGFSE